MKMESKGCRPDISLAFPNHRMMPGLQPLRGFNARFPGAVPQAGMVRTFGARVGKGQRPGLFEGHRSGLSKGHRSGLSKGQRPGPIPAYGIAIGIGHRNGWRAESPVSCPVFVVGTDGSGLQSLRCFNAPFRGAIPQAGMVRTVGAGEGGELRMEADEHEWGGARGEPSPFFSAALRLSGRFFVRPICRRNVCLWPGS